MPGGNSFGYLDIAGTRDFAGALAGAVRPGGGLVIDFNATAESVLPGFTGEPRTMHTGDISVAATIEYLGQLLIDAGFTVDPDSTIRPRNQWPMARCRRRKDSS